MALDYDKNKFLDFGFHKQKFSRLWNLSNFTWGVTSMNLLICPSGFSVVPLVGGPNQRYRAVMA